MGGEAPQTQYSPAQEGSDENRAVPQGQMPREELPKKAPKRISSTRTLKDDLQNLVHIDKLSLVRAASLESEKQRARPREERAPRRHFLGAALVSLILFALGALALGAMYVYITGASSENSVTNPEEQAGSIMFSEQTIYGSVDDRQPYEVRALLLQAREGSSLTLGAIMRIIVTVTERNPETLKETARPLTTAEFFTTIGAEPPEQLVRALESIFFLGIHAIDRNAPILVIPVTSYERAFAGMLSWEDRMAEDLAPFFTPIPPPPLSFSTTDQTSTSTDTPLKVPADSPAFDDEIIRNFDVRVLKDASGNARLLYAFPSRSILIIAESPHSFIEALSRLQAQKQL